MPVSPYYWHLILVKICNLLLHIKYSLQPLWYCSGYHSHQGPHILVFLVFPFGNEVAECHVLMPAPMGKIFGLGAYFPVSSNPPRPRFTWQVQYPFICHKGCEICIKWQSDQCRFLHCGSVHACHHCKQVYSSSKCGSASEVIPQST